VHLRELKCPKLFFLINEGCPAISAGLCGGGGEIISPAGNKQLE
jgi:hypothetical protein